MMRYGGQRCDDMWVFPQICFNKETVFSESNNRLFTECVPTHVIFIEGKENYLVQRR